MADELPGFEWCEPCQRWLPSDERHPYAHDDDKDDDVEPAPEVIGACPVRWELVDPNPEDALMRIAHHCVHDAGHRGRHRCACGEEVAPVVVDGGS